MLIQHIDEIDTIASIATALGDGGIGIIRISGPQAVQIASQVFIPKSRKVSLARSNRMVIYGNIFNRAREVIDEALCLVMIGPHSYTGEDVVELQCHGGTHVLSTILKNVLYCGARLAEPGEFTKRAFLNGRLNLTQAESIIEIIRSKSEKGLKQAVKQLEGQFGYEIKNIVDILMEISSSIEASLNYPDEIEFDESVSFSLLKSAIDRTEGLVKSSSSGRIYRDGISVVIVGKPNVGKSSLFNMLLLRERAIVTDVPGTTRDIVEENLSLDGVLLRLSDTAGIRETIDTVEKIGVSRAKSAVDEAGIIVFVVDGSTKLNDEDYSILDMLINKQNVIVAINKADLPLVIDVDNLRRRFTDGIPIVKMSVKDDQGIDELKAAISYLINDIWTPDEDTMLVTSLRQQKLLDTALSQLQRTASNWKQGLTIDIISDEIMEIMETFNKLTGYSISNELVDEIFSNFCVGK